MSAHRPLTAAAVRSVIWHRQGGYCAACGAGMLPDVFHAHHRQRRRDLGWCACNVLALHPECHNVAPQSVHQRPAWAIERGLIVPSWVTDVAAAPYRATYPWREWSLLTCDGHVETAPDGAELPDGTRLAWPV